MNTRARLTYRSSHMHGCMWLHACSAARKHMRRTRALSRHTHDALVAAICKTRRGARLTRRGASQISFLNSFGTCRNELQVNVCVCYIQIAANDADTQGLFISPFGKLRASATLLNRIQSCILFSVCLRNPGPVHERPLGNA